MAAMKTIEELAREAGINTEFMNMGGASHVTTEGCNGVAQAEFERFAALVRAQAMQEVWAAAGGFAHAWPVTDATVLRLVHELQLVASTVKSPQAALRAASSKP